MKAEGNSIKKLVSVIVPVYNVRPYLREALDSLLVQTYRNLEILVIDDGSNDGSETICDEYGRRDARITVIHQKNRGLSAARNAGLDRMTGDVVSFLDPDDVFHPDMIRTMLEATEAEQADIAVGGFSFQKTEGRMKVQKKTVGRKNRIQVSNKAETLQMVYMRRINTAPWNKIYRKKIWDDLRFPEGHIGEGTYVIFDIFHKAEKVVFVHEILIMHRIRAGSITTTCPMEEVRDRLFAYHHYLEFVKEHTPTLFSAEQLRKTEKEKIRWILGGYYSFVYYNPNDKKAADSIREMLLKTIKEEKLKNCGIPVMAGCFMAIALPASCRFVYRPFQVLRDMKHHLAEGRIWM